MLIKKQNKTVELNCEMDYSFLFEEIYDTFYAPSIQILLGLSFQLFPKH